MFAFAALVSSASGAPCPPPIVSAAPWGTALTPDGAAHVLARDAAVACWWVVDDAGDGRIAGRWDRSDREPLGVTALPDGRAAVVLLEPGAGVLVRTESGEDARAGVDPAWLAGLLASRRLAVDARAAVNPPAATPSGSLGRDDARR
ncbi:MAG: hypothetical protein Q8P18_16895 [Pseudomonadota bacterium]|nr:hypothetical protein [Pseudomonadota bacterium]